MAKGNKVAIVIPVYKLTLSPDEILSLKQCVKVLYKYKVYFVCPSGLDLSNYLIYCKDVDYEIVPFNPEYFADLQGYNRLMLSTKFYGYFLTYNFILIHQLDAFVFKDELEYWCDQNYDFIGAPQPAYENKVGQIQFLKTYERLLAFFNLRISNVGNGGLSLRKTYKCYWLLRILKSRIQNWGGNNEDEFFKYWGNLLSPLFKLPPDSQALKFAIETDPEKSLATLERKLPFGCHAFRKYCWATWEPFIMNRQ